MPSLKCSRFSLTVWSYLIFGLSTALPLVAQAQQEPVAQAPTTPGMAIPFEKFVLPNNGLEVILSRDTTLPLVAVNLWYRASPIHEAPGRTGFAHLFEHLMFQGSKHVEDDQHFKLLEARGASLINGTTSFDRTNYFETVPANELQLALWLESDRMGFLDAALNQDSLDNQRQVVMNERRQSIDNAPYGRSGEALVQALFAPGHPYHGYVMGSMADLGAATLDDVRHFYAANYAPANATLVVAGDFDVAQTKQWIDAYFGSLPRREVPAPHPITTPKLASEQRRELVDNVSLARIDMAWLSPAAYQPGDAAADILSEILAGGRSSRLYKELVLDKELAQDVSVGQDSLKLSGIFEISATARPQVPVAKLEAALSHALSQATETPPTEHEMMRAKNQIKSGFVRSLQRLGGFGGRADMLNRYNLYLGQPDYFAADLARYDAVTPQEVMALAKSVLQPQARAVVITSPKPATSATPKAP